MTAAQFNFWTVHMFTITNRTDDLRTSPWLAPEIKTIECAINLPASGQALSVQRGCYLWEKAGVVWQQLGTELVF
jgi:hypothetical protein